MAILDRDERLRYGRPDRPRSRNRRRIDARSQNARIRVLAPGTHRRPTRPLEDRLRRSHVAPRTASKADRPTHGVEDSAQRAPLKGRTLAQAPDHDLNHLHPARPGTIRNGPGSREVPAPRDHRIGTMQDELNEAGARGYRFAGTQGGETGFGWSRSSPARVRLIATQRRDVHTVRGVLPLHTSPDERPRRRGRGCRPPYGCRTRVSAGGVERAELELSTLSMQWNLTVRPSRPTQAQHQSPGPPLRPRRSLP